MQREYGFSLLEIMLVLLLLGITSSLVVLRFPTTDNQLAQQGEQLAWLLNETLERAEREGRTYGVVFSHSGWQIVIDGQQRDKTKVINTLLLPDDMELLLTLERQVIPLHSKLLPSAEPQVWLFPGGETTVFTVKLQQGKCQWQLNATGFFNFETSDVHCDAA